MTHLSRRSALQATLGGILSVPLLGRAAGAEVSGGSPAPASITPAGLVSRSGLPWASGVYDSQADAFAAFRGRNLDVLQLYPQKDTWAGIRKMASSVSSQLDPLRGNRAETILISYPMFPKNESPQTSGAAMWRRAANGEFDFHHDAAAASLARFPQRFIFRVGWEWNHTSFPWSCTNVALAPDYRIYFRRIVDRLRRYHPTCLIDWCSAKQGRANAGVQKFYPGGDWVDFISHDRYDWWPAWADQRAWTKDYNSLYLGGPRGIGAWLAYAKSEGKKMGIGEWAVVSGAPGGAGDNAFFIQQMLTFFRANAAHIAYECYFNRNAEGIHSLAQNPKAAAKYRELIAAGA